MERLVRLLLNLILSLVLVVTAARAYYAWTSDSHLRHPSGIWIALASDFKEGVFYRPLYSEESGYGGTRYFPLDFVVHGLLLKLGGEPRSTGYAMEALAVASLLAGIYVLLRRLGADRWVSFGSASWSSPPDRLK